MKNNLKKVLIVIFLTIMNSTFCMEERIQFKNGLFVTVAGESTFDAQRAQTLLNQKKQDTLLVDNNCLGAIDEILTALFGEDSNVPCLIRITGVSAKDRELFKSPIITQPISQKINLDQIRDVVCHSESRTVGDLVKVSFAATFFEYAVLLPLFGLQRLVELTEVSYDRSQSKCILSVMRPKKIPETGSQEIYNAFISFERRKIVTKMGNLSKKGQQYLELRKNDIEASCRNLSKDVRTYAERKEVQKDPLLWVSECHEWSCPLSRFSFPQVRNFFEKKLVDKVEKKPKVFVDFACGNLHQTMVLLEALRKKNMLPRRLLLIDSSYKHILFSMGIDVEKYKKKNRNEPFKLREKWTGGGHNFNSEGVFLETLPLIACAYNALRKCAQWYKDDLQIIMYPSADAYIKDCKENSSCKADVLTGVDYYKDSRAHLAFQLLKKKCLKKDGVSGELFKHHSDKNVVKFCLTAQHGNKEEQYFFDSDKSVEWQKVS